MDPLTQIYLENVGFIKGVWLLTVKYTKNTDGTIDIDGNCDLRNLQLTYLPFKFGKVTGDFNCSRNLLTTLEGCPKSVGGDFCCGENELKTLKGCPTSVGGTFNCMYNNLTTLKGCPTSVGGSFYCYDNDLATLDCLPEHIGGKVFSDFSLYDVAETIKRQKYIKTLLYDDEMPDMTDIFD